MQTMKIPIVFLQKYNKKILKFELMEDSKKPKWSWERRTKAGDIMPPDFKLYYKAVII